MENTLTPISCREARSLLNRVMAEHVEMPGFPQIIVTRGFIYQWLTSLGWNQSERGFSSLDYTTFGRKTVNAELTDTETRDHYLTPLKEVYSRA